VADIRVPVSVWHGTDDDNLAPAHGVWLREHISPPVTA
jgi:hypothetical protein